MSSPVRICEKCGKSIPADTEFCPHCGARKEPPKRSGLERLVDSFFTGLIVVVALIFGLAGACFLLIGLTGVGRPADIFSVVVMLAVGIGFLLGALNLIRYVRRRRAAQKSGL